MIAMNTEWNLSVLYENLQDPAYEKDFEALEAMRANVGRLASAMREKGDKAPDAGQTEEILETLRQTDLLFSRLGIYQGLVLATDSKNGEMMAQESRLMRIRSDFTGDLTTLRKALGRIENLDEMCRESAMIREHRAYLHRSIDENRYLLDESAEEMIAAMNMTGASAWENLRSFLASTLKVDYEGRTVTLSEVRNLAYDPDKEVRRKAYEAELESYEKIQDSVAFALNHIKNQSAMLAKMRGYESPLDMALRDSWMKRETLDALMEAVREYLPAFRKYMRAKAKYMGYENGLPWYELFAPLGSFDRTFSLEEAGQCLQEVFGKLSPDMAELMREAFEKEWIDFYPRDGKEGGAFCCELPDRDESRVLTNFDGTFGAVDTLAHELGHAFHNRMIYRESLLNRSYPMPVAETASTFNEIHLCSEILAGAKSDEERLALLENDLREKNQCIVDIYSRYLFETDVFDKCSEAFLMADDLNGMMLAAQEAAYGDGLDPEFKNSGMWICKSHYYMESIDFYNFPYAFGNLFAQGLYAMYRREGEDFMKRYREMLRLTGVHTIEEDGAMMGADLTDTKFWKDSLQMISEEIDEFCRLSANITKA